MNKNQFALSVTAAAGFIFLSAVSGLALDQNGRPVVRQGPATVSRGTQPKVNSSLANDFAGLNYTDEQKAEIDKIHRETEARKETVAKNDKLNTDQKNAMLLGYTRMEYGSIFKVLSPQQQKQIRQRIQARRATDQAGQKKQP